MMCPLLVVEQACADMEGVGLARLVAPYGGGGEEAEGVSRLVRWGQKSMCVLPWSHVST
jgi:hypothetical protein